MSDPLYNSPIVNPFGLTDIGDDASPSFIDIDNDGDLDAFVGNSAGDTLFFRNTGSTTSANFVVEANNFGLDNVGASSTPSFADIDGDGDLDAFIGNGNGKTEFFRNTGSASTPTFVAEIDNFGLTDSGTFASPSFVDIDNDGDLDAFIGERFGNTLFFRNTGTASAPSFVGEANNFGLSDSGGFATPTFADVDKDGDYDAFVGESGGQVLFFRNTGTAEAPSFTAETLNLGITGVDYFAKPTFADIDGDGDLDAFVGGRDGNILFFLNNIKPSLNAPTAINYIDTRFDDTFATVTGALAATDADGDTLTYGIAGGIDNGNGTVSLSNTFGTLTVTAATGDYSFIAKDGAIEALLANVSTDFTVTVSDGATTDSQQFTLNITQNGTTESNGNDTLLGTAGNDSFNTLGGNDVINGLAGADVMRGGLGNDVYWVDNIGDKVIETSTLPTEIDRVNSSITWILNANVENLTLVGTDAINGSGNALNNTLIGNAAANVLNGNLGADIMTGGLGNDTYWVDNTGDKVIETSTLSTEIDRVVSTVTLSLNANVENLTLSGSVNINGNGNTLNNNITGNSGNNVLNGWEGNDVLTGGLGRDNFRFTTMTRDRIADFSVPDDTIQLENGVFTQLTATGVLSIDNFKIGAAADTDDYVLYNSATGVLTYDSNGSVAGGATQIAILGAGLALTNADFVII